MRHKIAASKSRWRALKWIAGVLGLGGILGAYMSGVLQDVLHTSLGTPEQVTCRIKEALSKAPSGTRFTILISDFAGDEGGQQSRLVQDVLWQLPGVHVIRTCRELYPSRYLVTKEEAYAKVRTVGRQWLRRWNADLLLWGISIDERAVEVHFLRPDSVSQDGFAYSLVGDDNTLTLPPEFHGQLGGELEAVALASVRPVNNQSAVYVLDALERYVKKLEELLRLPPSVLGASRRLTVRQALGIAALAAARHSKKAGWYYGKAITAFEDVLDDLSLS